MQATNGSAVAFRTGGRLIGCLAAFALALSGLVFSPAAVASTKTSYFALGDSATFGYALEKFNVNYPNEAPSYFEEGFGNAFTLALDKPTEVGRTVTLVNDGCPNETSDGLIGHNLPGGGAGAEYDPCPYHSLDGFALHNSLASTSQLEDALSILKEGSPAHPIDAITLDIGMSDVLAAIKQCEEEVGPESHAVQVCVETTAANVTQPRIIENVEDILGVLDSTAPGGGHYTGPIILVGLYNPNSFVLAGTDRLTQGLNTALETEVMPKFANVSYANPFPVFNKGGERSTNEQKNICKYTEMCNANVQVAGGSPAGKDGDTNLSVAGAKALAKLVNASYLLNPAR